MDASQEMNSRQLSTLNHAHERSLPSDDLNAPVLRRGAVTLGTSTTPFAFKASTRAQHCRNLRVIIP